MDFAQMILENLKTAGVQQAHKEDKINRRSRCHLSRFYSLMSLTLNC